MGKELRVLTIANYFRQARAGADHLDEQDWAPPSQEDLNLAHQFLDKLDCPHPVAASPTPDMKLSDLILTASSTGYHLIHWADQAGQARLAEQIRVLAVALHKLGRTTRAQNEAPKAADLRKLHSEWAEHGAKVWASHGGTR